MKRWAICERVVPEVVAFPARPARYWLIRPEHGKPGQFRGVLVHDDWEDIAERTSTQAGAFDLVLDALKQHHWRQGLPIIVEVPA